MLKREGFFRQALAACGAEVIPGVLTGGGPGTATETLTLFAYSEGFKKFNIGMTSALSFMFLIVVIVFGTLYLAAAQRLTRRFT